MYRCALSLLLIPLGLISQSVSFGHCPSGSGGRDTRPHVHLHAAWTASEHGHSHGSCGSHTLQHAGTEDDTNPDSEPPPGHDADAVFFGPGDPMVLERTESDGLGDGAWVHWAITVLSPCITQAVGTTLLLCYHAPPPCAGCCPLYLRHLALLI